MAKNEAEELFESYLAARGIGWEYEKSAGDARPDYWLGHPALPVCEVRHVTASLADAVPESEVVGIDAYKPVGKAVRRKSRQGRELEGEHPYVVVLWAPEWPTDPMTVAGALFGEIVTRIPILPTGDPAGTGEGSVGFGRDAALHRDSRRHISAVAILRRFNPTVAVVEADLDAQQVRSSQDRTFKANARAVIDTYARHAQQGTYRSGERVLRVVTHHNMHASIALPLDVFDGPFDVQHAVDGGYYSTVFKGSGIDSVPRGEI